ncbi:ATP-binding cassette sub- D member 4, partial [Perkinsus olseni]
SGAYFSSEITLGHLNQTVHALRYVLEALRWFVQSYGIIIKWRAAGNRLYEFESALNLLSKSRSGLKAVPVDGSGKDALFSNCCLITLSFADELVMPGEGWLAVSTRVLFPL